VKSNHLRASLLSTGINCALLATVACAQTTGPKAFAGQASVFERSQPGRFTIVRDAGLKLKVADNTLLIEIHGSENVKRLFSSRPSDIKFKIIVPGDAPVSQTVQVVYQD
jgi:hypothetical protein